MVGDCYRFWAARVSPGASWRSKEGPERLRRSQERPREAQEKLRNERLEKQKNREFEPQGASGGLRGR